MSDRASITVAVRVRPPTQWEADRLPELDLREKFMGDGHLTVPNVVSASSLRPIIRVTDERLLIFDPKDEMQERAFQQKGFLPPGTKRYKDKRYMFDRVFDESAGQVDVFECTTKPLLDGLLDGFNATVFAYGATGCGKTYTISGTDGDPGIVYLTMAELFQRIEDKREELHIEVSLTFLEIYNEDIRDLLAPQGTPRGGLALREDKDSRVVVVNLTEVQPTSADEVKAIVLAGNARRTQSPTHANATSSRSHAVLQINVIQSPRTAGTSEERTMATLSIIDLAGSERASATKNMGERMQEGANINKSLLALGNCINALCESGGRIRHIPYRNSKLTRLLKFSLGGNCKTVMIVCIAPTSNHFDDTQNTLNYADRAKAIKTKVSRNYINVDRHVGQYVEAINRLNDEVAELKAKLAGKAGVEVEIAKRKKAEAKAEVGRAKSDIQSKVDQTRPTILMGATCQGQISAAQIKLQVLRLRIGALDAQAATGDLPSDLAAERGLLMVLASASESVERSQTPPALKAGNANSMFDATLRAVSERRSDRLDDASAEIVQLDVKLQRAEVDRLRAEAERDSLKVELQKQAQAMASLISMLARSNVMVSEATSMLQGVIDDPANTPNVSTVAASLNTLTQFNDTSFTSLLGESTAPFSNRKSSLTSLVVPRASSLSGVPKPRSRRSSSIGGLYPTPRKPSALRQSFSLLSRSEYVRPNRTTSEKKSLRWKDEAGHGSLDDSGVPTVGREGAPSRLGSESDWEDEKTDESESVNIPNPPLPVAPIPKHEHGPRRPRSKKLDPSYLKPRLTSLAEGDELSSSRRKSPLVDRVNQLSAANDSSDDIFTSQPRSVNGTLSVSRVPGSASKGRRRSQIGPMRNERPRRRSSMLASSPTGAASSSKSSRKGEESASRRSPARRAKRPTPPKISTAMRPLVLPKALTPLGLLDPNSSIENSTRGKPTWR